MGICGDCGYGKGVMILDIIVRGCGVGRGGGGVRWKNEGQRESKDELLNKIP